MMCLGIVGCTNFTLTPKQISGLKFWYDGEDPSGNNSPPADGTAIATVVDKSGNGQDVTQASGALQMTFKTNVLNGRSALLSVNANLTRYERVNSSILSGLSSFTAYSIIRPTTQSGNNHGLLRASQNGTLINGAINLQLQSGQFQRFVYRGPPAPTAGEDVSSTSAFTANNNFWNRWKRDVGADTDSVKSSNGATASLTPLTQTAVAVNLDLCLGSNQSSPTNNTLNGYLNLFVFYSKALTTTEDNIFTNYIKLKAGV